MARYSLIFSRYLSFHIKGWVWPFPKCELKSFCKTLSLKSLVSIFSCFIICTMRMFLQKRQDREKQCQKYFFHNQSQLFLISSYVKRSFFVSSHGEHFIHWVLMKILRLMFCCKWINWSTLQGMVQWLRPDVLHSIYVNWCFSLFIV